MASGNDQRDDAPLTLGEGRFSGDRLVRPWTWRLGFFLHALAAAELIKGLGHWAALIAAGGAQAPFSERPAAWFLTQAFFAVADPVAAVGLWVGAPWGVAIWLIAAVAQLVVSALSGPTPLGVAAIAAIVAAMALYLALRLKARGEND